MTPPRASTPSPGFMRNQWVSGAAALSIQRDALRVDPDAAAE